MRVEKKIYLTSEDIKKIIAEKYSVSVWDVKLEVSEDRQYGNTFVEAEVSNFKED